MSLSKEQTVFPSIAQQSIWTAAMALAPFDEVVPSGLVEEEIDALRSGEANLRRFMVDMFTDMYENPDAYGIPVGVYDSYMDGRDRRSMGHKNDPKESRLRNQFQQAIQFYQKLLFEMGAGGEVDGARLRMETAVMDGMINKYNLRLIRGTQNQRLNALTRLGMTIRRNDDAVVFENTRYPGMFTALRALARAGRGVLALTNVLRCDFRGLIKGYKLGLEDVVAILPEKLRDNILAMDGFMQELGAKITIQPLKNTTLFSPWKVSYTREGRSIYGFHAEPNRLEVYAYFNKSDNISRLGCRLKEEADPLYTWFNEHIPIRECRCPNNRRVDIGGETKRICGLMNRLEVINPDGEDLARLRSVIVQGMKKP